MAPDPTITVRGLTFTFPDSTTGLTDISLDLPSGSRTLLIGGKLLSFPIRHGYTEC
jgi:CCR4-NOT complex subunit CAF16